MIECDFAEWDVGHGGISQNMEVEVREEASPGTRSGDSTALLVNNTPAYPVAGKKNLAIINLEPTRKWVQTKTRQFADDKASLKNNLY
jgi:hypothetical protein